MCRRTLTNSVAMEAFSIDRLFLQITVALFVLRLIVYVYMTAPVVLLLIGYGTLYLDYLFLFSEAKRHLLENESPLAKHLDYIHSCLNLATMQPVHFQSLCVTFFIQILTYS